MNLYIFEMILKFIRMLFIAFISIFNISLYAENETVSQNSIANKDVYAVRTVVLKDETKVNTKKVVTNKKEVVQNKTNTQVVQNKSNIVNNNQQVEEKKELPSIQNNNLQSNNVITTEAPVVVEKKTSIEEFTGKLTGYGPNCRGCSGTGNLACKTREKAVFSLKNDGIYYNDSVYGKVRIVAAATSKFKCGTIITITKPGQQPFTAVVLDTGGSMRKAWANGTVWMDLAYEDEAIAGSDNLTGSNVKFSVQRYGW